MGTASALRTASALTSIETSLSLPGPWSWSGCTKVRDSALGRLSKALPAARSLACRVLDPAHIIEDGQTCLLTMFADQVRQESLILPFSATGLAEARLVNDVRYDIESRPAHRHADSH